MESEKLEIIKTPRNVQTITIDREEGVEQFIYDELHKISEKFMTCSRLTKEGSIIKKLINCAINILQLKNDSETIVVECYKGEL